MNKIKEQLGNATFGLIFIIIASILKIFPIADYVPEKIQDIIYLIASISIVWVIFIAISANSKFGTTNPLNRPRGLWRLIFNKIPTKREKESKSTVDIVIIYDSTDNTSVKTLKDINDNYSSQNINLHEFDYFDYRKNNELMQFLTDKKDSIDGIYFLLTDKLSKDYNFIPIIEKWGVNNEDKPIMYVDYSTVVNENITYGRVPEKDANTGLWRLLVRATQRSNMWKEQASIFRKYCFGFIIFFLGLTICNYFLFKKQREEDLAERKEDLEIVAKYKNLIKYNNSYLKYVENFTNLIINKDKGYLQNMLSFHANEVLRTHGLDKDVVCYISIWKNEGENNMRVAISDNNAPLSFSQKEKTVINLAFEREKQFVLWKRNLKRGECLIWDHKGIPSYKYVGNNNNNATMATCVSLEEDHDTVNIIYAVRSNSYNSSEDSDRDELFCFVMPVNEFLTYGICIEFSGMSDSDDDKIDMQLLRKQVWELLSFAAIEKTFNQDSLNMSL